MKRRILSVLMTLAMLATMLPAAALAAEGTETSRTVTVKNFWGPGEDKDKVFTFTVGEHTSICLEYMAGHDPTGYIFGGFVSDDPVVKSSGPEYRNMVFDMPDRDVTVSVKWVPEDEITYVFTFNGKENSSTISTGIGATISVNGTVLATSTAAGETITADIHPGDMVTVYSGERTSEKKKCSSWMSTSAYMIPDSYLMKNASTITFPMPSGPAGLTARWSDAYTVTVKNYNGTETKTMPGVFLPTDQIDFDIGTYPEYAWDSVKVLDPDGYQLTSYPAYPHYGAKSNLLYFLGGNGTSSRPTLHDDITIEVTWTQYALADLQLGNVGTGGSQGGLYATRYGPTVPVSAGTKPGSTFSYWSSEGYVTIDDATQADTTIRLNCETSLLSKECHPVVLTAHWDEPLPTEYNVTMEEAGDNAAGAGSYAPGTAVTVNAGTKEGYRFSQWTVWASEAALADDNSAETTFTMPAHQVILKASWRETYEVTIVNGGVGASGAGGYVNRETVTIDAGTKPGYIFKSWKIVDQWGRTVTATTNGTQATFTMPPYPLTATANWEEDPNAAYSVTLENAGTDAAGAGNYAQGATVTLNAGTRTGYTFSGWTSGDVTITNPTSATGASFTMPANAVTITANWTENAPTVRTLTIQGLAGGDRTETHTPGESVTLSAGTKAGYTFSCWTIASTPAFSLSGGADITFTMPDGDVTLLAVWTPEPDANGAITLYLDELPGPLTIDEQGYRCGEPNNIQHGFSGAYILTQRNPGTVTDHTVTVSKSYNKPDFNVTLAGVNIASADQAALLVDNDAKLTLTLQGSNTLKGGANHAGLELKATARIPETAVTINGTAQDSLTATGGDNGAGIGGACDVGYNAVTINGGVITATGGKGAAGIGSGNTYAGGGTGAGGDGTIVINGGVIIAAGTAGDGPSGALLGAAGIGAGYGKSSSDNGPYSIITITGGTVTATGVGKAPAIGGTYTGMIYISGGTVTTRRGDSQSTAEIGKCPDASGGVCNVHFCGKTDTKTGDAQIFVSGPNAISNKPASPTGTDNYYWNAIVYEGNSGQLYCGYYNENQAMELDTLTVPAGKTLSIPKAVTLKLPEDGLHSDGASFAGEGRVILGETYHYAKADGKLAPCEAMLIDSNGVTTTGIFNTLETIITGTMANDGKNSWLVYGGHKILLLTDVNYPNNIDLSGTRCTQLELDLNGKTLNMGGHTILADVDASTEANPNVFTISDSSPDGSGRITGSSAEPLVRNTTGRLVITGGAIENSGTGPAVQIENVRSELKLSGGSFSSLAVKANTGFTPAPLVSLLADGTAFYDSANSLWISPSSKKAELSNVSIQAAPAGLLPVTAAHEVGSSTTSIGGLTSSGGASYQWLASKDKGGSASPVAGANTATLSLNNGTLEAGGWYISCRVTVGGVTMLTDEVYVEATEPDVIATLAEGTYTYDGTAHEPAVTVKSKDDSILTEGTDYSLTYEDNINAGTAKVTVSGTQENPFDPVVLTFQISPAALTIQAKDQTVTGSGAPQSGTDWAQATGLISGDRLSALTLAQNEARTQVVASGASIQNAAGEDVTDCYSITYLPGTLTVSGGGSGTGSGDAPGTGSGSSSGGGSSSSSGGSTVVKNEDGSTTTIRKDSQTGAVTETTKHPDGSTTVVSKQQDGTVTTTETDQQGNRTETIERSDGSSSVTAKTQDGTTAQMETSSSGQVTASVNLSAKAAAQESAALLPLPALQARQNVEQAPSVTIETQAEGPVRVEVPVSNVTPGTVAMLVHPDGTTEVLKQTVPGEAGVVFTVEDGATVKIVDNSKRFADVAETNWAAPAVGFVTGRELFTGVSETDFAPEQPMTRGMLMTVLARLDGQDTASGSTWYESGVNWAKSNDISDGTLPMANVSREQLVVMLYRYAGSPGAADVDLPFPDTGDISDYARSAVNWAVSNGIVKGTDSGIFDPKGPATRAQTAQILENYIKLLDGRSGTKQE